MPNMAELDWQCNLIGGFSVAICGIFKGRAYQR
jgi:hypothetical protein